jgi:hypothetical protein
LVLKLVSNKTFLEAPYSPIFSTNTLGKNLNYDFSSSLNNSLYINNNQLINHYNNMKSNNIHILRGKRDGAPKFLNTSY